MSLKRQVPKAKVGCARELECTGEMGRPGPVGWPGEQVECQCKQLECPGWVATPMCCAFVMKPESQSCQVTLRVLTSEISNFWPSSFQGQGAAGGWQQGQTQQLKPQVDDIHLKESTMAIFPEVEPRWCKEDGENFKKFGENFARSNDAKKVPMKIQKAPKNYNESSSN